MGCICEGVVAPATSAPTHARICMPFCRACGVVSARLFLHMRHLRIDKGNRLRVLAHFLSFFRFRLQVEANFEDCFIQTSNVGSFNFILIYFHNFTINFHSKSKILKCTY